MSKAITEVVLKLAPLTNVCTFKSLPVEGNLAAGTVPDAKLDAFKLDKLAPDPLKVVALKVPDTEAPAELVVIFAESL